MTVGLFLTALGLGLRHGIDWDHIAAIADLSSTAETRRRGIVLSTLYALGHAVVVMFLGLLAIVFGAALPEGADVWLGRVVGLTLIALGAWVLIELLRKGRDFRLRSRWILVLGGTFAGMRRVREARARRRLSIQHDHEHEHVEPHAISDGAAQGPEHDHAHLDSSNAGEDRSDRQVIDLTESVDLKGAVEASEPASEPVVVSSSGGRFTKLAATVRRSRANSHSHNHAHSHTHSHTHEVVLADSVAGSGNGTAAGIGVLHGIGFESPTQIAVFVASTSLVGVWAGVSLLLAWVIGLVVANTFLAVLAAYGLLGAERNFVIYAAIAVFVAIASLIMGGFLLFGMDPPLPELS